MKRPAPWVGKATHATTNQTSTFTPTGVNPQEWQVRLFNTGTEAVVTVQTVDEDGDSVPVDGWFQRTMAAATSEMIVLRHCNPSMTVHMTDAAGIGFNAKVKAWGGVYETASVLSDTANAVTVTPA